VCDCIRQLFVYMYGSLLAEQDNGQSKIRIAIDNHEDEKGEVFNQ